METLKEKLITVLRLADKEWTKSDTSLSWSEFAVERLIEWNKEYTKKLKVEIEEALIDTNIVAGFDDLELDEMSSAVLSVLPFLAPTRDPVTLQTEMEKWQAGEIDRLRLELEKVTSWSPSQAEKIIQLRKELQRSDQIIDDLKIKLEDIKSRAKFFPGDSVWVLHGSTISRGIVWAVREGILRVTVTEQKITKDFLFRDVYATAEECRANILVEE